MHATEIEREEEEQEDDWSDGHESGKSFRKNLTNEVTVD